MGLSLARAVADAVLYEGYLLYPYRASSQKNQARWQFGILGPPGAAAAGHGEEPELWSDSLLRTGPQAAIEVHLRFLQLQARTVEEKTAEGKFDDGGFRPVEELTVGATRWLSWDEAVEQEVTLGPFALADLTGPQDGEVAAAPLKVELVLPVEVPGGQDIETLTDAAGRVAGRLVRSRRPLRGEVRLTATMLEDGIVRLRVAARNLGPVSGTKPAAAADHPAGTPPDRQDSIASSFIGTHLLLAAQDGDFLSLLDPPEQAQAEAKACAQHRCWPVLAGPEGQTDVLLVSPIILYDHPAVAPESSVELYDSTEIDEILTLRVLTLTDEEKAEARATDPRAAAVIDRCAAMSSEELQRLHGVLRDPHAPVFQTLRETVGAIGERDAGSLPWWEPAVDASVDPDTDTVLVGGVPVGRGSRVRVRPTRRADAQDLFFAGEAARVTSVHFDVDGSTHVGLVFEQDPAADLHEGYGRSFYYAPEELEPLDEAPPGVVQQTRGEGSRS
ncbi:hypothetical protein [Arthrobacter crystallopoietes]|uniref:hypothetical protein n=1 Tax=Crystallibacter crystallopoietes TaxID=37928 RepID=UPI003D1E1DB1